MLGMGVKWVKSNRKKNSQWQKKSIGGITSGDLVAGPADSSSSSSSSSSSGEAGNEQGSEQVSEEDSGDAAACGLADALPMAERTALWPYFPSLPPALVKSHYPQIGESQLSSA